MRGHNGLIATALLCSLIFGARVAEATTIAASGPLDIIVTDTGSSVFSSAGLGAVFSASFEYSQACPGVCVPGTPEVDEANFVFPTFTSTLFFGTQQWTGTTNINIQNDHPLDAAEAALATQLLGTPVAVGTLIDVWTVGGRSASVSFELNLASFDTTLFNSLAFQGTPPPASRLDAVLIQITEGGGAVYQAFSGSAGFALPEPSIAALLAAGLLALARPLRGVRAVRGD